MTRQLGYGLALFVFAGGLLFPADAQEGTFVGMAETAWQSQAKLWHHDATWWAVLGDGRHLAIHRWEEGAFVPGARLEPRGRARADVVCAGDELFVLCGHPRDSRLYALRYDRRARTYEVRPGYPAELDLGDGWGKATLARDGLGRLWIAHQRERDIRVIWSEPGDGLRWSEGVVLAAGVGRHEVAAVAAWDGHVGVLWSDTVRRRFGFRARRDGTPPNAWDAAEPLGEDYVADDHASLAHAPGGRLLAVTKHGTRETLDLFVRDPSRGWEGPVRVCADGTRPCVLFDESRSEIYVLYTDVAARPRRIVYRRAPLARPEGIGEGEAEVLIAAPGEALNDVTSTKQRLTRASGLIAAAKAGDHVFAGRLDLRRPRPPRMRLRAEPRVGTAPLTVRLAAEVRAEAPVTALRWDFGDGATGAGGEASHVYAAPGTYRVRLAAVDAEGGRGTAETSVVVAPAGGLGPGPLVARVDFGGAAAEGRLADAGASFSAERGWGWTRGGVSVRVRESGTYVCVENGRRADWEYALEPGVYFVSLAVGSPGAYGLHTVRLEGETVIDARATGVDEVHRVEDHLVAVVDGRLTVSIGGEREGRKTKICALEIRRGVARPAGPGDGPEESAAPGESARRGSEQSSEERRSG